MADIGKPVRKIRIEPEPKPDAPKSPEPRRPKKEPTPSR